MTDKVRNETWRSDTQPRWCVVTESTDYWCDFWLLEVTCWTMREGDTMETGYTDPWFAKSGLSQQMTKDTRTAIALEDPVVVTGYVKSDGCNEFALNGHACDGAESIQQLTDAWLWALSVCHAEIKARGGRPDWEPVNRA